VDGETILENPGDEKKVIGSCAMEGFVK